VEADAQAIAALESRFKSQKDQSTQLEEAASLYERLLVALSIAMPLAAWASKQSKL